MYKYVLECRRMRRKGEKPIQGEMTSTFLVQVASVPGHQAGQRRFEQSRYLHDLLVNTLTTKEEDQQQQIKALTTLVPQHEIVLRSGFSQTAQWGLEPNMFLQVSVGCRVTTNRRCFCADPRR